MNQDIAQIQSKITEAIPKLDKRNCYQILLIIFFVVISITEGINDLMPNFIFQNPLFVCNGEPKTEKQACSILDKCQITNDFTAIIQTNLMCENENFRSFIKSVLALGFLIGMLLAPLGDFVGRKLSVIISIIMQIFGVLLTLFGIWHINWSVIIIGQLLGGMSQAIFTIAGYVMIAQYLPDQLYQMAIVFLLSGSGISQMLFLPIYEFIPQWNIFLCLMILIPNIFYLVVSFFFLIEYPTFHLFRKKNIQQFKKNIESIALYNQSDQQQIEELKMLAEKFIQECVKVNEQLKDQKSQIKQYLSKLLCNKKYVASLILLTLIFSAYQIICLGTQDSMERTGYNFGMVMFLTGIAQVICYLLLNVVVNKTKRRKGLIFSIIITSVFGLSFMVPFVKHSGFLQTVNVFVVTAFTVFIFSYFTIMQAESFPIQSLSLGKGVIQSIGLIAGLFVPYMVIKMNDIGVHPIFASSVFLLVLGLPPALIIRETLGSFKSKQDNLEEQEIND